ncbi:hypothetical protein P8610_00610 [Fictibacillus sp. UD]|uniref:hypothetical protein n=1 Tax=Fictibacillus sp. UD TaxID=3038777 RepID=UPI00374725B2
MNHKLAFGKVAARNAFAHGQISLGEYKQIIQELNQKEVAEKKLNARKFENAKSHIVKHNSQGKLIDVKTSKTDAVNVGKLFNSKSSGRKKVHSSGRYFDYIRIK